MAFPHNSVSVWKCEHHRTTIGSTAMCCGGFDSGAGEKGKKLFYFGCEEL